MFMSRSLNPCVMTHWGMEGGGEDGECGGRETWSTCICPQPLVHRGQVVGGRTKGNSFSLCSRGVGVRGSLQDNQGNRNHRGRVQEAIVGKGSEGVGVSFCESQVHRPLREILTVGSCFLSELSRKGLR